MAENNEKKQKNKKINKMSMEEIEKAIEKTEKEQGGLKSKYALELIRRKNFLASAKK